MASQGHASPAQSDQHDSICAIRSHLARHADAWTSAQILPSLQMPSSTKSSPGMELLQLSTERSVICQQQRDAASWQLRLV